MNITIEQYNTAINGQKMQSELLYQQVVEQNETIRQLLKALEAERKQGASYYAQAVQYSDDLKAAHRGIESGLLAVRGVVLDPQSVSDPRGQRLVESILALRTRLVMAEDSLREWQKLAKRGCCRRSKK